MKRHKLRSTERGRLALKPDDSPIQESCRNTAATYANRLRGMAATAALISSERGHHGVMHHYVAAVCQDADNLVVQGDVAVDAEVELAEHRARMDAKGRCAGGEGGRASC